MATHPPILVPIDENGRPVPKFLDLFESVRIDGADEPKYYGDLHPDGFFVIRKHTGAGTSDEHLLFYFGRPPLSLESVWPNRAALTYVEYDMLY